jgi:4-hydroxy-3-polyprenylbenzoate decarboxylase
METLRQAGAVIMPACPSFYSRPQSLEALADTVIHRILDHLGVYDPNIYRWR